MNTTRKILKERFNDAKTAINTRYSSLSFMQSKGYKIESNKQICCPFHDDSTPSFSINEERNVWNCFGCHEGGHFLDLWIKYFNRYEKGNFTVYSAIEKIISEDPDLQADLGFRTIYRDVVEETDLFKPIDGKLPDFDEILNRELKISPVDTTSMNNVMKVLRTAPIDVIISFIADCECGLSETQLISKYYKQQNTIAEYISEITSNNEDITSHFLEALKDD